MLPSPTKLIKLFVVVLRNSALVPSWSHITSVKQSHNNNNKINKKEANNLM